VQQCGTELACLFGREAEFLLTTVFFGEHDARAVLVNVLFDVHHQHPPMWAYAWRVGEGNGT